LTGAELVVVLEEGGRVEIVRVEVAALPLLRLTVAGEKLQVTPKGVPPLAGQESVTGLEELLSGVTVIVAVAELPAVMDELGRFAARLKSGMLTLTSNKAPLWK